MSAERLRSEWSKIEVWFDPLESDPEAAELLRSHGEHASVIKEAVDHMKLIDRVTGGAIRALGYEFCYEPALWRRGGEAVLQARLLQQLAAWWGDAPLDEHLLRNVVVRHTFFTSYAFATPRLKSAGDVHFLIIPFVYQELLMLCMKAVDELAAGLPGSDPWYRIAEIGRGTPGDLSAPPAMRRLLARIVTDSAFDPTLPGANPAEELRLRSEWFASAAEGDAAGEFESVVSYAATDFAISHELGHRILDAADAECADGDDLEAQADLIGFRLFVLSWGWRDELLEACPMCEAFRMLLGPIGFFYSAGLLFHINQAIGARLQTIVPDSRLAGVRSKGQTHLGQLKDRWQRMLHLTAGYLAVLEERGFSLEDTDLEKLAAVITSLRRLTDRVTVWIEEIPADDLRIALGQ